ncbi:MAG: GntR family transcriptional regulator [Pseudomonadota bacterium]
MTKKLTPIRSETLQSRVYGQLKAALMAGHFAPNQELKLRDLAAELGTSPMPVREALHRLVSERALSEDYANRSSVRVPELSIKKFEDLIEARILNEGTAAGKAAKTISKSQVSKLSAINDEIQEAIHAREISRIVKANRKFHFEIYEAASSPILLGIIDSLWLQSSAYFHALIHAAFERVEDLYVSPHDHHGQVLKALRKNDPEATKAHIVADIEESAAWFQRYLSDDAPEVPASTNKAFKTIPGGKT